MDIPDKCHNSIPSFCNVELSSFTQQVSYHRNIMILQGTERHYAGICVRKTMSLWQYDDTTTVYRKTFAAV